MLETRRTWKRFPLAAMLLLSAGCATNPASIISGAPAARGALFEYRLSDDQVTGIAVSRGGRVFLNFPRWGKDPRYSVAEVMADGTLRPYPDAAWNRWGSNETAHPEAHFVCVQSVYVDDDDFLWILDPASPSFQGVVRGGAKLLKVDLASDRVEQVLTFDGLAAPHASYLNDIRIDPDGDTAYITDSGTGAILVVDLATGHARRVLAHDPSTRAEPGYVPVIGGRELRTAQGEVPQIHADGLAIDVEGEYLYYHALTARTLYRIRTSLLKDPRANEAALGAAVERVADTGAVDGMIMDGDDNLYFTALELNAVRCLHPDGTLETVVRDDLLDWPDSLSLTDDNYLYITSSQIDRMPRFNSGADKRVLPYRFFRTWLGTF